MAVEAFFELDQFAHLYANGRAAVYQCDGFGRAGDIETALLIDKVTYRQMGLGSVPLQGRLDSFQRPDLAADNESATALAGTAIGDFSWFENRPWERRTPDSVSVFVPASLTPEEAAQIMGIPYLDAPDATPEDEDEQPIWFRPLGVDLMPDPGTELAARLSSDARRWDGSSAWEVVSSSESIGPAVLNLAEATDLALITALDRYRDRADALHHGRRLGDQWSIDWDGPDEESEWIDPRRPFQFGNGVGRPEPGPIITSPLVDHVIVYDDGAIFTAKATTVGHRTDNPWFDDVLAFEAQTNTGDAITLAWLTSPGLAAILRAPTLPHPSVNDLLLATTAGDLTWLDGRNPLDYLTHPLEPAS